MKKFLILFLIFYFLVLLQNSFFIHFGIFNKGLNLVLIALFLVIFFSPSEQMPWECFLAGFFLDLFSKNLFGVSMLILFLLGILIKQILNNIKKTNILAVLLLFGLFHGIYHFLMNYV